ncbi:hypothetical protein GUJ93_ZPchr0011g27135 [Zizania palustris]|uniref:Uncharacterized protein n=1 Tax=Zizania palustris TaxID=103762 RepID=A0A8J6BP67_ZIZPA|nr:hypothetical protein GUJ93_ZPchr0011g27135 [Zizania palustris]
MRAALASVSSTCFPALEAATPTARSTTVTMVLELSHGADNVVVETGVVAGKPAAREEGASAAREEGRHRPWRVASVAREEGAPTAREEGAPAATSPVEEGAPVAREEGALTAAASPAAVTREGHPAAVAREGIPAAAARKGRPAAESKVASPMAAAAEAYLAAPVPDPATPALDPVTAVLDPATAVIDKFARNKEFNSTKRKMNPDNESSANADEAIAHPSIDDDIHRGDQGEQSTFATSITLDFP